MFENWIKVLIKPRETFKKEKNNASFVEAAKIMVAAGVIIWVVASLIWVVANLLTARDIGESIVGIVGVLMGLISIMIILVITLFIGSGVCYIPARILGGRGNFTTQTYLIALSIAPILILGYLPAGILLFLVLGYLPAGLFLFDSGGPMAAEGTISVIGFILGAIIMLFVSLYSLALLSFALQETHEYRPLKVVLTILISWIFLAFLSVLLDVLSWYFLGIVD